MEIFANADLTKLIYYIFMEKNFTSKLKTLLIIAMAVNMFIIVMQAMNTAGTIKNARLSLHLMGETALSTFEGGRRALMLLNSNNTKRFKTFLQNIGDDTGIKSIYLFDEAGNELLNTKNVELPYAKSFMHSKGALKLDEGIFMYKKLPPMRPMGRGLGMRSGKQFHDFNNVKLVAGVLLDDKKVKKTIANQYIFLAGVITLQLIIFIVFWYTTRLMKSYTAQSKKLKLTEREAEMGKMSLVMAHELKNPLSSVKGLIEFSAKKVEGTQKDIAERCVGELERLDKIVNEFLSYGKDIQLNIFQADLNTIVDETRKLLELDAENKNIDIEVTGRLGEVNADAEKMKQVIFNLMLNAIQATPENETIKIEMKSDKITIKNPVDSPEFDMSKVGDPFYTTKTVGTGLGLAIVKRIVQLHGFEIKIEFNETFNVEIAF
jgi:two-component system sensor histidine kinase HydH